MIQLQAAEFWGKILVYEGQEMPKFSAGWLENWKGRFGIKRVILHAEDGSVNVDDKTKEIMQGLQEKLMAFEGKDIYNMDETALYWRRSPDHTLATKQLHGTKKSKSRLTA